MEYTIEVINIKNNSSCNLSYGDRPYDSFKESHLFF